MSKTSKRTVAEIASNPGRHVVLSADWHGNVMWAVSTILRSAKAGVKVIYQLGDFGLWDERSNTKYFRRIHKELVEHDMYVFVTLGNHENYDLVETMPEHHDSPGLSFLEPYPRVVFMKRPYAFELNGKRVLSVGGANSIDMSRRTPRVSWWPQEQIDDEIVRDARAVGKVDIMFCHDIPFGTDILSTPGSHRFNLPPQIEMYAEMSSRQLKRITDVTKPDMLFHGHYHMYRDRSDTFLTSPLVNTSGEDEWYTIRDICLNMDGNQNNRILVDTDDWSFSILDDALADMRHTSGDG